MNYGISVLFRAIPLLMALFFVSVMDFLSLTMEWTPADSSPDLSYSLLALFV